MRFIKKSGKSTEWLLGKKIYTRTETEEGEDWQVRPLIKHVREQEIHGGIEREYLFPGARPWFNLKHKDGTEEWYYYIRCEQCNSKCRIKGTTHIETGEQYNLIMHKDGTKTRMLPPIRSILPKKKGV